ncbi:unnamed protein product [Rotaria sp. Silwood1]|nr:unnamed protein product [Rotaria sp. Silwood1]
MVGIDARNKHLLNSKYICPVCSLILRDPVQLTQCRHRQCQTCTNVEQQTTIKCRQCQAETLQTEVLLDQSFTNEMKSLPIDCSFCQWNGVLCNYQEHLNQSHSNLKCDYCGKHFDSAENFHQHKVFECQQLIVDCILKDFGCNERIIRAKMEDHYLTEQHQNVLLKVARQMLSQLNDRQMDVDLPRTTTAGTCNPTIAQSEELDEMLNILVGGIEALTNDEQRLTHEALQMQIALSTLAAEQSKVKLSIEESNIFLEEVKHNQDLSSLQENVDDLQCVSYDGTLVWKITNFREKMSKMINYFYTQ